MGTKIVLKKKYFGIAWVWVAFLLPYIEVAAIREVFEIRLSTMTIPAVFPVMLALWAWLYLGNRIKGYNKVAPCKSCFIYIDLLMGVLLFFSALVAIAHRRGFIASIEQALIFVPYMFARETLIRVQGVGLSTEEIVKYGVPFYVVAQLGFLLINIFVYGFSFDGNAESRIISVGGGPVILGYTIALVLACWLLYRNRMPRRWNIFVVASCLLLSFATGSRGSMWPVLLIALVLLLGRYNRFSAIRWLAVLLGAAVLILFVDLESLFPRLFLTSGSGRFSSVESNLKAFRTFTFPEVLFGKGLGEFFPIQMWNMNKLSSMFVKYNQFYYEGISLLVQPHNSFVFALMELGVVGLAVYTWIVKRAMGIKILNEKWGAEWGLFVLVALAVLFFESTLFIATGAASLWWLILLVGGIYNRERSEEGA